MLFPECIFIKDRREDGFTLIELLVSIFIFAIVMSLIYGTFRTVINSAETVKHGDLPYEEGRSAMERISQDMDGLYVSHEAEYNLLKREGKPDPYNIKLEKSSYSGKSFSSLRFISSSHTSFGGEGQGVLSEIRFYVAPVSDDRYELRRSDRRFYEKDPEPSPRDPVLCRNVIRFEIEAADSRGMTQDTWDTESGGGGGGEIPSSFSFLLETGTDEGRALFKTSVMTGIRRMKNLSVPDDVGGTAIKGGNGNQEVKK